MVLQTHMESNPLSGHHQNTYILISKFKALQREASALVSLSKKIYSSSLILVLSWWQALDELWLSNCTSSRTVAPESSFLCHDQLAFLPSITCNRPCPKLASQNNENFAYLWSALNLHPQFRYISMLTNWSFNFYGNWTSLDMKLIILLVSKAFSVSSITNGYVYRDTSIFCFIIDPCLEQNMDMYPYQIRSPQFFPNVMQTWIHHSLPCVLPKFMQNLGWTKYIKLIYRGISIKGSNCFSCTFSWAFEKEFDFFCFVTKFNHLVQIPKWWGLDPYWFLKKKSQN